jgi:hypothetical protein
MIDKSFIDRILDLAPVQQLEIEGLKFTDQKIYPVLEPEAQNIDVHTLTGLVDYYDTITGDDILFHVKDYYSVSIVSTLFGINKQRETFITATAYDLKHRLNSHMPVEEFIVYLQSMFVQDETTANIMKIVGNLTQGVEQNVADDGVTQRVTARAGVTRVQVVDLPNPVTLRPFRTFSDIEQPESKFILRIKADGDRGPQCALYEADGGAWKNKAISTIKQYLEGRKIGVQVVA